MVSFEIRWRSSTKKDLRSIPRQDIERILIGVDKLSEEPFPLGFRKLAGTDYTYRIRIGDYRIIYEVFLESKVVEIAFVRHRKDAYR